MSGWGREKRRPVSGAGSPSTRSGKVERGTLNSIFEFESFLEEPMNAERLTTKSREVISAAVATATQRGHATVEAWHLLLALLDTGGSTASALLRAAGANAADVRRAAVKALDRLPTVKGSSVAEPTLAREFANAIGAAEQIARPLGDEYTSTEHLLAGLARVGGPVADALRQAGATEETLVAA